MKSFLSLLLCVACTAISLGAEAQQVAFIKSISGSDAATSLDADYVQMLTGKAAVTAARRAGKENTTLVITARATPPGTCRTIITSSTKTPECAG